MFPMKMNAIIVVIIIIKYVRKNKGSSDSENSAGKIKRIKRLTENSIMPIKLINFFFLKILLKVIKSLSRKMFLC